MTAAATTLSRHYEVLAPAERLSAVLEATARGDHREAARLRSACPRRDYTAPDRAFADRLLLAFEAAAIAAIDLRALCARLDTLRWAAQSAKGLAPLHRIGAEAAFLLGVRHGYLLAGCGESGRAPDTDPFGDDLNGPMAEATAAVENTTATLTTLFDRAERTVVRELAAVWSALGRFARRYAGVEAATLLAARGLGRLALQVDEALARHPGVSPEAGRVADYADALAAGWAERFRTDDD